METKKKIWLNILVVVVCLVILVLWVTFDEDLPLIVETLKNANYTYILICFVIMLISMITEALSLHIIVDKYENISFYTSMNIAMCANFYNGITPFASGGQPFQVYYYSKAGIKPENSTSALVMAFIINQFCVCLFSIIAVIIFFNEILHLATAAQVGITIGITINLAFLVGFILMAKMPKFKRLVFHFINLFAKFKFLVNRIDHVQKRVENFIEEFQVGVSKINRDVFVIVFSTLLRIFSMFVMFITPFYIIDALGITMDLRQIFHVVFLSVLVFSVMSFMPTPGAAGGAEMSFEGIFVVLGLSVGAIGATLLLWRFFTYYFKMFVGFISVILLNRSKRGVNDESRVIHG